MMGEFKGTKGKWHNGEHGHIVNEFAETICQMYRKQEECYDNHKANALLISKAPEMLEMLEEIADTMREFDGWRDEYNKIKQLIKEATTL